MPTTQAKLAHMLYDCAAQEYVTAGSSTLHLERQGSCHKACQTLINCEIVQGGDVPNDADQLWGPQIMMNMMVKHRL